MTDPIHLLDIEERLAADRDGSVRAALLEKLQAMRERLVGQRRELSSPERQRRLAGAQAAVDGALDAVGRIRAANDKSFPNI